MPPVTRVDTDTVSDGKGNILSTRQVTVDITADTIRDQARQALIDNRTFVAIASPTNAQVVAQTKALTRQNNGIIRLLLGLLDGTD